MVGQRIPRQPHRYSGRTAINAEVSVHEPKPPQDVDAPLSFSMEGFQGQPPSPLISHIWAPGWNSPQAVNKFQIEVNGPLHDGDPGIRFIEPSEGAALSYFEKIPEIFMPRKGQYLVLPVYHIFGSEELSILAPGIASRSPQPYLVLTAWDAEYLNKQAGQTIKLILENDEYTLPLKISEELPRGLALLSAGLPGLEGILLPAWGKIASTEKRNGESQAVP
jgi:NADH-quinone oxidoreductase subunit G